LEILVQPFGTVRFEKTVKNRSKTMKKSARKERKNEKLL